MADLPALERGAIHQPTPVPEIDEGPSSKGLWPKIVTKIWDSDYYTKSDAERKLVNKLDCTMVFILTLGFFMKYVDQTNLNNAYVSGMKEDLNIQGNEYTYMLTIFNAVNTLMTIPSAIVVMYVRPSYWLCGCELGWAVFTFAQAGATSVPQIYVFRFFVAFFEAVWQPTSVFILGSWYTKRELGKRISIWYVAAPFGQAVSGFMQARIYTDLNGVAGLAGWRWLYIVCGIMTVPCGVGVYFLLPDYPSNCKAWFITEADKQLALRRCAKSGISELQGFRWSVLKRVAKSWHLWVIVPVYVIQAISIQNFIQFGIYLRAMGYSVQDRNVLPSISYVIGIPVLIFYGWLSDRIQSRFLLCFVPFCWGLISTGILAVWPNSNPLRVFAFMINMTLLITHIFYTWSNEICHESAEERGLILGIMNTLFFATNAWLPTIIFLQTDGPSFRKGFPTTFACMIVAILGFCLMHWFHRRQIRQEAQRLEHRTELAGYRAGGVVEAIDDKKEEDPVVVVRSA